MSVVLFGVVGYLGAVLFERVSSDQLLPQSEKSSGSQDRGYRLIKDANGRELNCKITAKDQDFVVIEREGDTQSFLINIYSLSRASRGELEALDGFDASAVEHMLYLAALRSVKVELQYVPSLTYFRCSSNGAVQKSCEGLQVDQFRQFLVKAGVQFSEKTLSTTPAKDGYVYLPDGVRSVPCIKIGSDRLYTQSQRQFESLMAAQYSIQYSVKNSYESSER